MGVRHSGAGGVFIFSLRGGVLNTFLGASEGDPFILVLDYQLKLQEFDINTLTHFLRLLLSPFPLKVVYII